MASDIYKKLATVQLKLIAPKEKDNEFGGFKYRSAEDILKAVKPLLKGVNASLILSDEMVNNGERYYIKATANFIDNDSGEAVSATAYAREQQTKKGMDESQITGLATSYARKYALGGLFAIDNTKDADSMNNDDDNSFICSDCKNPITEHKTAKGIYTAQAIAEITTKNNGRPLCWNCAEAIAKAAKAANNNS